MLFCRLVIAVVLAAGVQGQELELRALAKDLREQIGKAGKKMVAIWEITNTQGYSNDLAQYVEDELSIKLLQDGPGFRMVTRSQLNRVMKEQGLRNAEEFNPATFAKVGKFTGADAIITGNFQVLSSAVRVTLRVLDVSDGTMVTGASAMLPKTKDVEAYLQKAPAALTANPTAPEAGSSTAQLAEAGPFQFRLEACSVNSTLASCRLKIVSPRQDRTLTLGPRKALLFDEEGNEFPHTQLVVGTNKHSRFLDAMLVRDTPVNAEIQFALNRDVKTIRLLKILVAEGRTPYTVEFRNIRPAALSRPASKK